MSAPPVTSPGTAVVPFASSLARYGDRPAISTSSEALSYSELAIRVRELGERLGPRRRLVLIRCANAVDPIVAYLAALAGGHPVLLVPGESQTLTDSLITRYDPDVVMSRTGGQWRLEERREGSAHDLHPDLALLLCTSGSTGSPKLVRLSHENLQANAESIATYLDIRGSDRAATTLPMSYCYGLSVINSHLSRGASLVVTELSVVDSCFWDLFRESGCRSFAGVPYTFDLLDRIGFLDMDLPELRYVTQAGGRLSPNQVQRYVALARRNSWEFFVMYGQTEATARMAYLPPHLAAQRPDAIGIPIPGGSFTLQPIPECPAPDTGELVYRGANVMLGYAETPGDLALGRTVDTLRTGDIARLASDGLYEIVGRRSRFVKIAGLRLDLDQAEATLAAHGLTVACGGDNDELILAYEGCHEPAAVRARAAACFGLPAGTIRVCGVPELPRLPGGKLDHSAASDLTKDSQQSPAIPKLTQPRGTDAEALRQLFAEVLGRPSAALDSSFISLGGDSLSYVEMSVRLEQALGHLPTDWHLTPIQELGTAARPPARRGHAVETGVALRAVGILLIVCTHAQLFDVLGSAHVLVAIAGFNFARFHLTSVSRRQRLRTQLVSLARIAIPSMAWIMVAFALTEKYSVANIFLLNAVVGAETWNQQWHFWFVEVLLYILVGMAALLAVPWVDRAERRAPFGFPVALLGLALLSRFELLDLGVPNTLPVLWLFALGWATARADTGWQRLLVMAAIAGSVPGFFGDPIRELVLVVGLTMLLWVPSIRCPWLVSRVAAALAGSSLYIYLTHWEIYPYLSTYHPMLAVAGSLVVGVLYWRIATTVINRVARSSPGPSTPENAVSLGAARRHSGRRG